MFYLNSEIELTPALLSKMINKFKTKYNNPTILEEFKFLFKVGIVVGIPSILTFLEPDTGVVLIYLLITIVMLFISGIRYRWFGILGGIILGFIAFVLIVYFVNNDLFIKIFGSSFFLRVDRLLDWSSGSGYQLKNGITSSIYPLTSVQCLLCLRGQKLLHFVRPSSTSIINLLIVILHKKF